MSEYAHVPNGWRQPRWAPDQAVRAALREVADPAKNWYRMCDSFAGGWCFGYAGSGNYSARSHWEAIDSAHKHHDLHPPGGAMVWWNTGSFAHIAIVVRQRMDLPSLVASTDILHAGRVSVVPIDYITTHWGAPYWGWAPPHVANAWGLNPLPTPRGADMPLTDGEIEKIAKRTAEVVWNHQLPESNDNKAPEHPAKVYLRQTWNKVTGK